MLSLEKNIGLSYRKYAIRFNLGCIFTVLVLPVIPILLIWLVASCVMYTFLIGYPDAQVARYTRLAGYRFYGSIGTVAILASFTQQISVIPFTEIPIWVALWVVSILVVMPLGIRDILSIKKLK